jgi:hypothetical protein
VKVAKWAVPRVFAGALTCIPIRGPTSADPVLRAKTLLSLILQQNSKPGLLEMVIAGQGIGDAKFVHYDERNAIRYHSLSGRAQKKSVPRRNRSLVDGEIQKPDKLLTRSWLAESVSDFC